MDLRCIKIISVVTCLLYLSNVIAQPRVDGGTSAKVVKSSPVVSNFVGWVYDRTNEKWSGYYNCICGFYKNNNKVPQRNKGSFLYRLSCCISWFRQAIKAINK